MHWSARVFGEVVVFFAGVRLNRRGLVEQRRLPVTGFSAHEAVETLKTQAGRPAIKRAAGAGFPHRRQMVLTEHGCVVTVQAEYLSHSRCRSRYDAAIAGIARGYFANRAHSYAVMITAGQ